MITRVDLKVISAECRVFAYFASYLLAIFDPSLVVGFVLVCHLLLVKMSVGSLIVLCLVVHALFLLSKVTLPVARVESINGSVPNL